MLTVILGEAQLELVPRQLHGAPSVKRRARERRRAPEYLLLDQAADHEGMRDLPEGDRRGRPDIVHLVTLLVQDSPLTAAGKTRLLIHTRDNGLLRVRADLRPPRSQATFYKLLEDVLRQGRVPLDKPLLTLEAARPLSDVLAKEATRPVILLSEKGQPARTADFAALAAAGDLTILLGGFPKGDWTAPPVVERALRVASTPLSAASALVPVLAGAEDALLAGKG